MMLVVMMMVVMMMMMVVVVVTVFAVIITVIVVTVIISLMVVMVVMVVVITVVMMMMMVIILGLDHPGPARRLARLLNIGELQSLRRVRDRLQQIRIAGGGRHGGLGGRYAARADGRQTHDGRDGHGHAQLGLFHDFAHLCTEGFSNFGAQRGVRALDPPMRGYS